MTDALCAHPSMVPSPSSTATIPTTSIEEYSESILPESATTTADAADSLLCSGYSSLLHVDTTTLPYEPYDFDTGCTVKKLTDSQDIMSSNNSNHNKENGQNGVGIVHKRLNNKSDSKRKLTGLFRQSASATSEKMVQADTGATANRRQGTSTSSKKVVVGGSSETRHRQRGLRTSETKPLASPTTEETAEESEAPNASANNQIRTSESSGSNNNKFLFDRYGFVIGMSHDDECDSSDDDVDTGFHLHGSDRPEEREGLPSTATFLLKHHGNGDAKKAPSDPDKRKLKRRDSPKSRQQDENPALQQRRGAHVSVDEKTRRVNKEQKREKKWVRMIQRWDRLHNEEKKRNKRLLRKRVRKGIPNALRGTIWVMLADVPTKVSENPQKFHELIRSNTAIPSHETRDTIERDIHRTFPRHLMFLDIDDEKTSVDSERKQGREFSPSLEVFNCGKDAYISSFDGHDEAEGQLDVLEAKGGQASLRRVLNAYSMYDSDVGYCQGMNFIAATFLTFMPEEEAFWLLVVVMNESPCKMRGLFGDSMQQARQVLFVAEKLIEHFFPQLWKHFERENIHITMFATQWLLTVYTSSFPFDLVAPVWDCFIAEGWKIVYRVMLALLQLSVQDLMRMSMEEILAYFSRLPSQVDGPAVMAAAFQIPLKSRHILKYETEWKANN